MEFMLPVSSRSLQYYVIARRWLSDLEFFRLESGFLHQLLDRYITRLQELEMVGQLVDTGKKLQQLEQMVADDKLSNQLTQLELMAEDIIPEDAEALAATQVELEHFMSDLTKQFRTVKKEIYQLILTVGLEQPLIPHHN